MLSKQAPSSKSRDILMLGILHLVIYTRLVGACWKCNILWTNILLVVGEVTFKNKKTFNKFDQFEYWIWWTRSICTKRIHLSWIYNLSFVGLRCISCTRHKGIYIYVLYYSWCLHLSLFVPLNAMDNKEMSLKKFELRIAQPLRTY